MLFLKLITCSLFICLIGFMANAQAVKPSTGKDSGLTKVDTLRTVTIRAKTPVARLKGDTIEFNPAAVKLSANATIEALLGRLPGFYVDPAGVIYHNGKKVEQLLVDGEEIFADKPSVIARSLNADMIAKVELLDRKDKASAFSGVDNGNRVKTINLVLKESSKAGYFGKAQAGAGLNGCYDHNGLAGYLKGHRQLVVLGMAANTGISGVAGDEDIGGGLFINTGKNDPMGASAGTGIPVVLGTAGHFADRWAGELSHLNGDLQYTHTHTEPFTSSITRQLLPDTIFTQLRQRSSNNIQEGYDIKAAFDQKVDSANSVMITAELRAKRSENYLQERDSTKLNDLLTNTARTGIYSRASDNAVAADAAWRTAFNAGRSVIALRAGLSNRENTANGTVKSATFYGASNGPPDSTDQRKVFNNGTDEVHASLFYSRPLWKGGTLEAGNTITNGVSTSRIETFSNENSYHLVDSLSSDFSSSVLQNQVSINIVHSAPHSWLRFGLDINNFYYRLDDHFTKYHNLFRYHNLAPTLVYRHTFNKARSMMLQYLAVTRLPDPGQLQQVRNNNNPLIEYLGNPTLRPTTRHTAAISYNQVTGMPASLAIEATVNSGDISTKTETDPTGKQVIQPVNVKGGWALGANFSIQRDITPTGLTAGLFLHVNQSANYSFTGNMVSRNSQGTYGGGVSLQKQFGKMVSFDGRAEFVYIASSSSVNTATANNFWSQDHSLKLSCQLPFGVDIFHVLIYNWVQAAPGFITRTSVVTWNAGVRKTWLKGNLTLKWQVNNLLDQAAHTSRSVTGNQSTESTTNVAGRYGLITLSYRFKPRNIR